MYHLKPLTPIQHSSNRHALPTLDFQLVSHRIMIFLRFLHGLLSLFNPASLILAKQSDHNLLQGIYGIYICLTRSAFRFRSSQFSSLVGTRRGYTSIDFVNSRQPVVVIGYGSSFRRVWDGADISESLVRIVCTSITFPHHHIIHHTRLSVNN